MNKIECLNVLNEAKKMHSALMFKIDNIIDGTLDVESFSLINKEECVLGQWIYSNNVQTKDILGDIFYTELEALHSSWHEDYMKIRTIYLKKSKKGFISKIFSTTKVDNFDRDKAKAYYDDLMKDTKGIAMVINKIYSRLQALPDSKFQTNL